MARFLTKAVLIIAAAGFFAGGIPATAQDDLAPVQEEESLEAARREPRTAAGVAAQAIPLLAIGFTREEGAVPSRVFDAAGIRFIIRVQDDSPAFSDGGILRDYAGVAVSGWSWREMPGASRLEILAAATRGIPLYICSEKPRETEARSGVIFNPQGTLRDATEYFASEAASLVAKLDYIPAGIGNVAGVERRFTTTTFFELTPPVHPAAYKTAAQNEALAKLKAAATGFTGKYFYAKTLFSRPELRSALDQGQRSLEEAWFAEPMRNAVNAQKISTRKRDIFRIFAVVCLAGLMSALYAAIRRAAAAFGIAYVVILFSFALTSWNPPGAEFSLKHIRQDDALRVVTEVQAVYRVNTGVRGGEPAGAARFESFDEGAPRHGASGSYLKTERRFGRQIHRNPYPTVLAARQDESGGWNLALENRGRAPLTEAIIGLGGFAVNLGEVPAGHTVNIAIPPPPAAAKIREISRDEDIGARIDALLFASYVRRAGPLAKSLTQSDSLYYEPRPPAQDSQVLAPYAESGTLFDIFPLDAPWLLAAIREPAGAFESVTVIEQTGLVRR